jgi:hypothetical protein
VGEIISERSSILFDLNYNLTNAHWQDFIVATARVNAGTNTLFGQLLWGLSVGVLVAGGAILTYATTGNFTDNWAFFVGAWFFWLVNFLIGIWLRKRFGLKLFPKEGTTHGKRNLIMSDEGLVISGEVFKSEYNWSSLHDCTRHHLISVIWMDHISGIMVPRTAFKDSAEEVQFHDFISAKLKSLGKGEHIKTVETRK